MRSTLKAALIAMLGIGAGLAARALRRVLVEGSGEQATGGASRANGGAAAAKRAGAADGRTRAELYEEAKRRGIRGRSQMTKAQLAAALGEQG